jgi:hypothetical protein
MSDAQSKRWSWSRIDTAVVYSVGGAVALFGLCLIYFFVVDPIVHRKAPIGNEVVLALASFAIGAAFVAYARFKTKSVMWLMYANITFWFLLYGVVFEQELWLLGIAPSTYAILHAGLMLALTVFFGRLAYVSFRTEAAR